MRLAIPGFAIIDRYVAREVLAPFAVDVGLLTFALVTGKLLKLMDMVVNHGVSLGEVMGIMGYIMPAFLELTFPMAVLLGVLMGFGRMSSDQEMTAARACGVSSVSAGGARDDGGAGRVRAFELLRVLAEAVGEF